MVLLYSKKYTYLLSLAVYLKLVTVLYGLIKCIKVACIYSKEELLSEFDL